MLLSLNTKTTWGQEEKGMTEDEQLDGITDSMDVNLGELWASASDWGLVGSAYLYQFESSLGCSAVKNPPTMQETQEMWV